MLAKFFKRPFILVLAKVLRKWGVEERKKTTLFLWSSKDLEFEFSMSPYSHWDASSSGCKNNSLRKISGLVSKWIMDDSRLENSRYPSEWVSDQGRLAVYDKHEVALDR